MSLSVTEDATLKQRFLRAGVSLCLAINLAACSSVATQQNNAQSEVMMRASQLMTRYSANDFAGVLELIDKQQFTMWGSDIKEVVHSSNELQELMRADFALWGTAKIDNLRDVDFRTDGRFATAFFSLSFQAGRMPPVPVRVATTWIKRNGEWFLTQSANSVPTRGQSAAVILHAR